MRDGCPFCEYDGPSEVLERHTYEYDTVRERSDTFFIIEPLNPVTVGHVIVVVECVEGECSHSVIEDFRMRPGLLGRAMEVAAEYAARSRRASSALGKAEGCNLIVSAGAAASQTVMHLHVHVIPRREGDGLLLPWSETASDRQPMCPYCGLLGWTVRDYGRVTHKQACPHRTDPWHQGDPHATGEANT